MNEKTTKHRLVAMWPALVALVGWQALVLAVL